MTSVRQALRAVNATVARPAHAPRVPGRALPARDPRIGVAPRRSPREPATGKVFPKDHREGSGQASTATKRSTADVSSAGFSTGSSWPASMMRTTASG